MAETPEGRAESISGEEVAPAGNPDGRTGGEATAPSCVRMEQLRAQKREIDEAGQGLVREYVEIDHEIKRHENGGCARAMAHDVH